MTWILILTMIGDTYMSGKSPAIAAVHGFASQEACMAAGRAWNAQAARMDQWSNHKALCVPSR